jgi:hypothetical protein
MAELHFGLRFQSEPKNLTRGALLEIMIAGLPSAFTGD